MTDNTKDEVTRVEPLDAARSKIPNSVRDYIISLEAEISRLRRLTSQPAQSDLVEAASEWLRELAKTCRGEASDRFRRDDDTAEEWRVRGESYAFIADQIERGDSPLSNTQQGKPVCGDVGAGLCDACSQPIGDLTQQPGCGGPPPSAALSAHHGEGEPRKRSLCQIEIPPTTTQPDRERVLREAAAIARKARETTYAGGNISQGYIAAAGDIERQILALLAQAPEQSDTQSDAVRDGPEITYEVWEDDFLVASSSSLTDAGHYLAVCSQDADFRLVKAETYRTPIRNEAADTGVNARSIVGEGE